MPGDDQQLDLEQLKIAYQESLDECGADCPSPDELAALAIGELIGPERDAVSDRVLSCRSCLQDYRLLSEIDQAAILPPAASRRRGTTSLVAVAACALLAVSATLYFGQPNTTDPTQTVRSTGAEVVPTDGVVLAQAPATLGWPQPQPGQVTVEIYDEQAQLLSEIEGTGKTRVELPDQLRQRLNEGGRFSWVVQGTTQTDGPFWFTVEKTN